jgi:hypothetical protein
MVAPVGKATSDRSGTGDGVLPCEKNKTKPKFWLTVQMRFLDDRSPVPAAACRIEKGSVEISSSPLTKGTLELSKLESGSYTASFPDIDASEWDVS